MKGLHKQMLFGQRAVNGGIYAVAVGRYYKHGAARGYGKGA